MSKSKDATVGGVGVVFLLSWIFMAVCYIVGVIAGFSAAWWMGIICLIPVIGWFNGLVYIGTWGGTNIAAKIVAWIIASAFGVPYPFC